MNDERIASGVTPAGVSWEFRVEKPGRITISLTKRAAEELEELQEKTGMSKTDLVNRSIGLYRFVTNRQLDGCEMVIRDHDGKTSTIYFQ